MRKEGERKKKVSLSFAGPPARREGQDAIPECTMQDVFLYAQKPLDLSWQGPLIFFENSG